MPCVIVAAHPEPIIETCFSLIGGRSVKSISDTMLRLKISAAVWEARGVYRKAKGQTDRVRSFREAASRFAELGRARDEARCLGRAT